ncbi:MAG: hypothetical protein HC919_02325 [Oscillatoriales cyanobacterium SM2_2_1]|nr:hypothetical protein [Oscillatoriales cyanobacterium SM2_2_1]
MSPSPLQIHIWQSPPVSRSESPFLDRTASRQRLHGVLQRYEPSIEILTSPRGKPYLAHSRRFFSVTHCQGAWLCAVLATSGEVRDRSPDFAISLPAAASQVLGLGCDLEYWHHQHRAHGAIAHRYFTPDEQTLIRTAASERERFSNFGRAKKPTANSLKLA